MSQHMPLMFNLAMQFFEKFIYFTLQVVVDVQTAFLKKLADCADAACQKIMIRSFANAGLPDTLDLLLTHAETSKDSGVSEEALRALRRIDRKLITSKVETLVPH